MGLERGPIAPQTMLYQLSSARLGLGTSAFTREIPNKCVFPWLVKSVKRLFPPIQDSMNINDTIFTHNTKEAAEAVEKPDLHDDYKEIYINIERWINVIVYITLPVFGGFGNILTFIVMQRASLKDVSTCFYMSMLALADTGKSIVILPFKYHTNIKLQQILSNIISAVNVFITIDFLN